MKLSALLIATVTTILFSREVTHAFEDGAFRMGLSYYSQNVNGKLTRSVDGSASTMGTTSYSLFVKYDWLFLTEWFLSPQISYSPLSRKSAGDSAETTMLQLNLPIGTDLYRSTDLVLDWQTGLGVVYYSLKGAGGVETLSNGTGSSQFARPSRSISVQNFVYQIGTALSYSASRFGVDIVFEGLLSSGKRSESLMLSYAYRL